MKYAGRSSWLGRQKQITTNVYRSIYFNPGISVRNVSCISLEKGMVRKRVGERSMLSVRKVQEKVDKSIQRKSFLSYRTYSHELRVN